MLQLVLRRGPITTGGIAQALGLAQAGVRRHLSVLESRNLIEEHQISTTGRGRGRPARYFVATNAAHREQVSEAHSLAVDALSYLANLVGPEATKGFARHRAGVLVDRYATRVEQAGVDPEARANALARALNEDGFAATVRPGPGGFAVQLCQGHCPVHQVAEAYPEICQAETSAIGELLGVHVQRLATLADGHHVCTTCVPLDTTGACISAQVGE